MATTQQDIVEEIIAGLYAYTQERPAHATLTQDVGTSGTTLTFESPVGVPRGLIEIDDELIEVSSASTDTNMITVPAWGRAQQGTTAAAHASGSRIVIGPLFPRARVGQLINQVIGGLDGGLYGVAQYEFTPSPAVSTYTLPSGTNAVLSAAQDSYGPSLEWFGLKRYSVDLLADASLSGRSITFYDRLLPGRDVKLVLQKALVPIESGDLLTDSGLSESHRDIVVMGVQIKLLMNLDMGRLQSRTVQSTGRDQMLQPTSASTIAARMQQLFMQRVSDEKRLLMEQYPTRIRRTF